MMPFFETKIPSSLVLAKVLENICAHFVEVKCCFLSLAGDPKPKNNVILDNITDFRASESQ